MLRLYVLALLLLGSLVSCGPTDLGRSAANASLRTQASAATRSFTADDNPALRLEWSGNGPYDSFSGNKLSGCLKCGTGFTYVCPENKTSSQFTRSVSYTVPPGFLVVGARAQVYGASVDPALTLPAAGTVAVTLNNHALKTTPAPGQDLSSTSRICTTAQTNTGPCDGTTGTSGISLSTDMSSPDLVNGINWNNSAGNEFKLVPTSATYCISRVDLELIAVDRRLQADTAGLAFGSRKTGTSAIKSFLITNDGGAPLTISSFDLSDRLPDGGSEQVPDGSSARFTVIEPVMPSDGGVVVLQDGQQDAGLHVKVRFTPDELREFNGNLTITSNAVTALSPISLSGTGVQYATEVDRTPIQFGEIRAKTTSNPKTLNVRNAGDTPLTLTLSAADAGVFVVTAPSGTMTLDAGESQPLTLEFRGPSGSRGPINGTLNLRPNTGEPDVAIQLEGLSTEPILRMSPDAGFAFGPQRTGVPQTRTVEVTNIGTRSISFQPPATLTGAFTLLTPHDGGIVLAPDSGTQLQVRFTPDDAGTLSTSRLSLANVESGDPDYATYDIALSGSSGKPVLLMSPDAGVFGTQRAGNEVDQQVTVSNTGNYPIVFSSVGPPLDQSFTILGQPDGGYTLPAADAGVNSTLALTVRFKVPSDAGTSITSSIPLVTNDPDYPNYAIPLSGRSAKPVLAMDPDAGLAYGLQLAGSTVDRTVTVRNTGTYPIEFTRIVAPQSGAFAITTQPPFPITLNPDAGVNSQLSLTVQFVVPTSTEAEIPDAIELVNADREYSGYTIPLSGSGGKPELSMDPAGKLDFKARRAGSTSEANVTVTNNGSRGVTFKVVPPVSPSAFGLVSPTAATVTLAPSRGPASDPRNPNGTRQTFRVRFKAPENTEDEVKGVITLEKQDKNDSDYIINLAGSGKKPRLEVEPPVSSRPFEDWFLTSSNGTSVMDFRDRPANSEPEGRITVSNKGTFPITLDTIRIPANNYFSFINPPSDNIRLDEAGGQSPSVTLRVKFKAPADQLNPVQGVINFTSEDPDYQNHTIGLKGRGVKPNVVVQSPVEFGEVVVGVPKAENVVVTNSGTGSVTFSRVEITNNPLFKLTPERQSLTVAAGTSETLVVTFAPITDTENVPDANLILYTGTAADDRSVTLKGRGIKPSLRVDSASLVDFGPQNVGEKKVRSVTVTNTGSGKLLLSNITANGAGFSVPSSTLSVPGGESRTIDVAFYPTVDDPNHAVAGTLTFLTNDPRNSTPPAIDLSGLGVRLLTVTPAPESSVDFGSVIVGETSPPKTFTLVNNGTRFIKVDRPVFPSGMEGYLSSDFPTGSDSVNLGPGRPQLTLNVYFAPKSNTSPMDRSIELVKSDAFNKVISYSFKGSAAQPSMEISVKGDPTANALNFGDVVVPASSPVEKVLVIKNTGSAPLKLEPMLVVDADFPESGIFASQAPTRTEVPFDGGTAEVTVSFKPTARKSYSASLQIPANISGGSKTFRLKGQGLAALISVDPTSLNLNPQRLKQPSDPQTFTVKNDGDADLKITAMDLPSVFSIKDELLRELSYPLVLKPNESKILKLIFTPTTVGATSNVSLKIYSNAKDNAIKSLPVTASGVDGYVVTDPASELDFGKNPVSATAIRRNIRIMNTGGYPLTIRAVRVEQASHPDTFEAVFNNNTFQILQPAPAGGSDAGTAASTYDLPILFKPTFNGQKSAQLVIDTDSVTQAGHFNVTLKGTPEGAEAKFASDEAINLGKVNVGSTSAAQILQVNNTGVALLTISEITFTGVATDGGLPPPDDTRLVFSVGPSEDGGSRLPVSVDAGSSVPISLFFSPLVDGARQAVLTVKSNSKEITKEVKGEGVSPELELDPKDDWDFKGVIVSRRTEKTILLKNIGTGVLKLDSSTLVNTGGGTAFALKSNFAGSIPEKGSSSITVTFTPPAEKPFYEATLTVPPAPGSLAVAKQLRLVGSGITGGLSMNTELDFGKRLISKQSQEPVEIRNLTLSDISVQLSLEPSGDCTQFELDPAHRSNFIVSKSAPEMVKVGFTPAGKDKATCVMRVETADKRYQVTLRGEGIPAVISVSRTEIDFGKRRAEAGPYEERLTIKNLSSSQIILSSPLQEESTGEPFEIKGLEGAATSDQLKLSPGVERTVTVVYKPQQEKRSASKVWFGTVDPQDLRAASVQVFGEATRQFLGTQESVLDFGRVEVGSTSEYRDITVSNGSAQTQRVFVSLKNEAGAAADVLPFLVSGVGSSGLDIESHKSITFRVAFNPRLTGDVSDVVQIRSQDNDETKGRPPDLVVTVTGTGRVLTGKGAGAGGCSVGGAWGGVSVLALLALSGLRSRRRRRN